MTIASFQDFHKLGKMPTMLKIVALDPSASTKKLNILCTKPINNVEQYLQVLALID